MTHVSRLVLAGAVLCSLSASAQSTGASADEWIQARFRYGAALHQGSLSTPSPGLSYSGWSPADLEGGAGFFPFLYGGLTATGRIDSYGVFEGSTRVGRLQLGRFQVAPTGRVTLGPVKLEGWAGYSFAGLPSYAEGTLAPTAPLERHSALVGARVGVEFMQARASAFAEVHPSLRGAGYASGTVFGATVSYPVGRIGPTQMRVGFDYQMVYDEVRLNSDTYQHRATAQRLGLALQLAWLREVQEVIPTGELRVRVVEALSGQPIPGAAVELSQGDIKKPVTLDAQGQRVVPQLLVGPVTARAVAGGYLPQEASTVINADGQVELQLRLSKAPPSTGGLMVRVVDGSTELGLPGAVITLNEVQWMTNEGGEVLLPDLPPGPVEVNTQLDGYHPGQEVAQVSAGVQSNITVRLLKLELKQMAVIKGQVRSTDGGTAVPATLEIPEAKLKTKADGRGAFLFNLPAGNYSVRISAPGYRSQTKAVKVKAGGQAIFNVDLYPQ